MKITEDYTIEFHKCIHGYEFTVKNFTHNNLYRVKIAVTNEMFDPSGVPEGFDVWSEIYNQIQELMSREMQKKISYNEEN